MSRRFFKVNSSSSNHTVFNIKRALFRSGCFTVAGISGLAMFNGLDYLYKQRHPEGLKLNTTLKFYDRKGEPVTIKGYQPSCFGYPDDTDGDYIVAFKLTKNSEYEVVGVTCYFLDPATENSCVSLHEIAVRSDMEKLGIGSMMLDTVLFKATRANKGISGLPTAAAYGFYVNQFQNKLKWAPNLLSMDFSYYVTPETDQMGAKATIPPFCLNTMMNLSGIFKKVKCVSVEAGDAAVLPDNDRVYEDARDILQRIICTI